MEEIAENSVADLQPQMNHMYAFKIEFVEKDFVPVRAKCRPLPYQLKEKVKETIEMQLKAGIIRKSFSNWASALRVVVKEDGTIRITVEFSPINKLIKDANHPMPAIVDLFNILSGSDTFTKLDLKVAYHQLPVHEDSIKYIAFVREFSVFEYLSIPMGIKSAPAWFQRYIEEILQNFVETNMLRVYLDDLILFTNCELYGFETHVDAALKLIDTLNKRSLKISITKSNPVVQEVELLGNKISKNQIKPNPDRAKCLMEREKPANIQQLQSWLGVSNYYRRF